MASPPDDRTRANLVELGGRLADEVRACLPGWSERRVGALLDAWGRLTADDRRRVCDQARAAGEAAAARIAPEIVRLSVQPVLDQAVTPMQLVRTCFREPTEVLRRAGVPEVVRDPFDERVWPDDVYGLAPRAPADLDAAVSALHLAWAAAKVAAVAAVRPTASGTPVGPRPPGRSRWSRRR